MNPQVGVANPERGQHICLPSETDEEREATSASFLHEGLARGKRCVFIGSRAEYERIGVRLEDEGICSLRAEARGALRFLTPEEAYLDQGTFDPDVVLERLDRAIDRALADGFPGLWATGELIGLPSEEAWRSAVRYEAGINESFGRRPLTTLCRCQRTVVPPHRIQDVLRTHPVAIVRGEACDNPFYEPAQLALSDDAQSRVDWQLRQLRVQNRALRQLEEKATSAVTVAVELAAQLETLRATMHGVGSR